jgi:hypothetical protein
MQILTAEVKKLFTFSLHGGQKSQCPWSKRGGRMVGFSTRESFR